VHYFIRPLAEGRYQMNAITAHVHVRTTHFPIDKVHLNTL
jgi:hypothetical protein